MSSLQLRAYRVETAPVPKDWLRLGHNYGGDAHERSHEEEDGRRTDGTAVKTHDITTETTKHRRPPCYLNESAKALEESCDC